MSDGQSAATFNGRKCVHYV